jgi:hypothetical protein
MAGIRRLQAASYLVEVRRESGRLTDRESSYGKTWFELSILVLDVTLVCYYVLELAKVEVRPLNIPTA